MENIKKELQKMKQEKETSNHEIETLRKLNKIQIQALPNKEKEIRRLAAIIEKERERVEQMKSKNMLEQLTLKQRIKLSEQLKH